MSLKEAPESVQLAVDLIYLLESHHIDPKTALKALEIVRQDYEKKLATQSTHLSI
ncbi:pleiotropic regulatory protein RsmS [Proteus terrae]|uniref:pleiotropic regulatory protein RsmS n=1 Tax=Proteus terrae TaxID=1574161 RepID=UPI0021A36066|nr:pleiotropic regulatory protein RsmS [Proteus terrae]